MIKLSIFIPTYNRLNRLYELLQLIDSHFLNTQRFNVSDVEIVISANDQNEFNLIKEYCLNSILNFTPKYQFLYYMFY